MMNDEKGQILLWKGRSRYDVTRVFIDDLAEAFRALNRDVEIIDALALQSGKQLLEALQRPTACIFAFNRLSVERDPLFDQQLFFNAYIDDPFPSLSDSNYLPIRLIVTSVERADLPLLEQWRHEQRFADWQCATLSHGGSLLSEPFVDEERPYDLMFAGSYTDPEVLRSQWTSLTPEERSLLEEFIVDGQVRGGELLRSVWEAFVNQHQLSELAKRAADVQLFPRAEMYLRNQLRKEVLSVLAEAGICVDLYGVGWRGHPLAYKHRLRGSLDYRALMRQMRKTRIVLNINPLFTQGSHERPLTAMLQKAVVMTDRNPFFASYFHEGEQLCTYDRQQLNELPSRIRSLLDKPQLCREIGEKGY